MNVPPFWFYASCVYFVFSILWSIALLAGAVVLGMRVNTLMQKTKTQMERVTTQAKSVAAKASSTAGIVHAQTQNLLGNAQSTGNMVTRQARTVGAALTVAMVASRAVSFARRFL